MGLFNKFFSLFKRKKEDKSSTKDTENLEKDNLKEETTLSKELKKDTYLQMKSQENYASCQDF